MLNVSRSSLRWLMRSPLLLLVALVTVASAVGAQVDRSPQTVDRPAMVVATASPSPTPLPSVGVALLPRNVVVFTVWHRATGQTERIVTHNSRVNAGASAIASLIGSTSANPFNYVALSSSSAAVSATDSSCPSEYSTGGLSRAAATYGNYTAPGSLNGQASYTLTHTWTSSASSQTIYKICALNASSGGTLGFETLLGSSITVNNGDTANLTWTFNV